MNVTNRLLPSSESRGPQAMPFPYLWLFSLERGGERRHLIPTRFSLARPLPGTGRQTCTTPIVRPLFCFDFFQSLQGFAFTTCL